MRCAKLEKKKEKKRKKKKKKLSSGISPTWKFPFSYFKKNPLHRVFFLILSVSSSVCEKNK